MSEVRNQGDKSSIYKTNQGYLQLNTQQSAAAHAAIIMGQPNPTQQSGLTSSQYEKNPQKYLQNNFLQYQNNVNRNAAPYMYSMQMLQQQQQQGPQAQQGPPPFGSNQSGSLSSSQQQQLLNSQQQSQHQQSQNQQQQLAGGVNASNTGVGNASQNGQQQNSVSSNQQAQGSTSSSQQSTTKGVMNVNGLGSNNAGNSGSNLNASTGNTSNSNNGNSSNPSQNNNNNTNGTNGQQNLSNSNHLISNNANNNNSANNNSSGGQKGNNSSNNNNINIQNSLTYHRMGDTSLCKQNLICFHCDKNICDECQDHQKEHQVLSIDKIYENSFSNAFSFSQKLQKSYQSCIDSIEKNEKSFFKFQEGIRELVDNAYHNYKIAEAYNSRDYKLFGTIFRKNYCVGQNQDQSYFYQEKQENQGNKDFLTKQFEKNLSKLSDFMGIMNQLTIDEIETSVTSTPSAPVSLFNVINTPYSNSSQNMGAALHPQQQQQQSNPNANLQNQQAQANGNLFQLTGINSANSTSLHMAGHPPPPPLQPHQTPGGLTQLQNPNYQYIGNQAIFDPHMGYAPAVPGGPPPPPHQMPAYFNMNMRLPQNQHLNQLGLPQHLQKLPPAPPGQGAIFMNGASLPNNFKQSYNFNSCQDHGPTKKIQTHKHKQICHTQNAAYGSSQGLSASLLSQNNISTYSKQQMNNSSTGFAQSQQSSEDSLHTQNDAHGLANIMGESGTNDNQNKLLSSDHIQTKQEAIELNSKTSSHSNIPIPPALAQANQVQQKGYSQMETQQRPLLNQSSSISPPYSSNYINGNNFKTVPPTHQLMNQSEDNPEQQSAKNKPKKHHSDETKEKAYKEHTENGVSIKELAKNYQVVEGTIKKWIQDFKDKKPNQTSNLGVSSIPNANSTNPPSPVNHTPNSQVENQNESQENDMAQNSSTPSQQDQEMMDQEEQSEDRQKQEQSQQQQPMLNFKVEQSPEHTEHNMGMISPSESEKKEYGEGQLEMKLICFRMLQNKNYPQIPLESTVFALSKDYTIQIRYIASGEQQDQLICEETFNRRIKELKFAFHQQEAIIFIHLEDDSLYMWRWQQKENYQFLQKRVHNFDVFLYFDKMFIIAQKGDTLIQVFTIDNKLISSIDNLKPQEDFFGDSCSIQNIVGWGSEDNQQWYICCNSGNYFWAYQLDISEDALLSSLENHTVMNEFKIIYKTFSEDQQEIFKMRLHKNHKNSQEIIGASDSGFLYIFDIIKGTQSYFKMKSQGEKQMLDIQVFHPYYLKNSANDDQEDSKEYDEPKIILCYDNFIRIRKYKKLQFPQGMRCATLEVKTQEIIVYYVLNNQDTILKHVITFNS